MLINKREALTVQQMKTDELIFSETSEEQQVYGLLIALANQDLATFNLLWLEHRYLWSGSHLEPIIRLCVDNRYVEGLKAILEARTTH